MLSTYTAIILALRFYLAIFIEKQGSRRCTGTFIGHHKILLFYSKPWHKVKGFLKYGIRSGTIIAFRRNELAIDSAIGITHDQVGNTTISKKRVLIFMYRVQNDFTISCFCLISGRTIVVPLFQLKVDRVLYIDRLTLRTKFAMSIQPNVLKNHSVHFYSILLYSIFFNIDTR